MVVGKTCREPRSGHDLLLVLALGPAAIGDTDSQFGAIQPL